jgi:hypothetical protein
MDRYERSTEMTSAAALNALAWCGLGIASAMFAVGALRTAARLLATPPAPSH